MRWGEQVSEDFRLTFMFYRSHNLFEH